MQVGRRMELTPLGRSLAQPVREILLNVQSTVVASLEFDPALARRNFVIRASDYLTTVLVTILVQIGKIVESLVEIASEKNKAG